MSGEKCQKQEVPRRLIKMSLTESVVVCLCPPCALKYQWWPANAGTIDPFEMEGYLVSCPHSAT